MKVKTPAQIMRELMDSQLANDHADGMLFQPEVVERKTLLEFTFDKSKKKHKNAVTLLVNRMKETWKNWLARTDRKGNDQDIADFLQALGYRKNEITDINPGIGKLVSDDSPLDFGDDEPAVSKPNNPATTGNKTSNPPAGVQTQKVQPKAKVKPETAKSTDAIDNLRKKVIADVMAVQNMGITKTMANSAVDNAIRKLGDANPDRDKLTNLAINMALSGKTESLELFSTGMNLLEDEMLNEILGLSKFERVVRKAAEYAFTHQSDPEDETRFEEVGGVNLQDIFNKANNEDGKTSAPAKKIDNTASVDNTDKSDLYTKRLEKHGYDSRQIREFFSAYKNHERTGDDLSPEHDKMFRQARTKKDGI